MGKQTENVKVVTELTPNDFRINPIWSWYDDDNSLVISVEEDYLLSKDYDEYDPLFILSELTLHDGTNMQGDIALSMDSRQVYLVSFFQKNETFEFSLPLAKDFDLIEKLSNWLNKLPNQIFPVKYKTSYLFNDEKPIAGEINI